LWRVTIGEITDIDAAFLAKFNFSKAKFANTPAPLTGGVRRTSQPTHNNKKLCVLRQLTDEIRRKAKKQIYTYFKGLWPLVGA